MRSTAPRLGVVLNQARTRRTFGHVGDDLNDCRMALFFDAGDCKSTSAVFLAVFGPATHFPLSCICQKHCCVSDSMCEAGVVAMSCGPKQEGLPASAMWEALAGPWRSQDKRFCYGRKRPCRACEAGASAIEIDTLQAARLL